MKVLIAARLSKLQKNGKQGDGIETQDEKTREWARDNGHEVIDVIPDNKSGTVAPWDRPNLRPWVTEPSKMAMYDAILAYKNDRLSRGAWEDETRIRLWAEEHGKKLLIKDGPQWPPRHDGDFWSWTSQAKQARAEWEETRERSMREQKKLRTQKKLVGSWPFGFESAGEKYDRKLIATETGRIIVPAIYRWVIRGDSLGRIAERLDALGVPTVAGGKWWARSVGLLVRNPTYVGRHKMNEFEVDDEGNTVRGADLPNGKPGKPIVARVHVHQCESLVDEDVFRRAGEALDKRPKKGPTDEANRALLSGVIRCPRCQDSPMYRICPRNQPPAYRCAGRGSQRKGCGNMVPEATADNLVRTFMLDWDFPIMESRLIPGDDYAAEKEAVEMDLRDLPMQGLADDAEDAERARLRAERTRLRELPATPDEVMHVPTGQSYGQAWATLEGQEQGAFLRQHKIGVFAIKQDAGPIGPMLAQHDALPDNTSVTHGGGVSVAVCWLDA